MTTRAELLEALKKLAFERDGMKTLRCANAFALADELGAKRAELGELCSLNGIKIVHCQLGCFK